MLIALLRIALGWLILYQGIVAWTDASWSLAPYVQNARTLPGFYEAVLSPTVLPVAAIIVKSLFVLVGALLIIGIFARLAAFLGILLMVFFYLPLLRFPYVGTSRYIVDEHVVYALVLGYLFVARAGEYFGLGTLFRRSRY